MKLICSFGLSLLVVACLNTTAFSAEHPELKAYPAAKDGMQRIVIILPEQSQQEAANFKVELVAGKQMLVDGVNLVRLNTSIEGKTLKGWGYSYYDVTASDLMISTKMAVPDDVQKVNRFVAGKTLMIPYNSRLPIVIYTPKGYDIRYRIWHADNYLSPENSLK